MYVGFEIFIYVCLFEKGKGFGYWESYKIDWVVDYFMCLDVEGELVV